MADEVEQSEGALPPPTEEVHLPGPSYLPVVVALGLTIAIVGVIKTWVVVAIGLIIFLVALVKWIRQARQEMSQLPLEH
jgi:type IV secretory pathway TrbD component